MNSIRTIVVEDEAVTARNLIHLLGEIEERIEVVKTLDAVQTAVDWFNGHADEYDLILMDIRLSDGLSFDIFKQCEIQKPVIFVTAYNDYALDAFKNNGIDYILKPFDEAEIKKALDKYKNWIENKETEVSIPYTELLSRLGNLTQGHKKSFLVHYRDKLIPLEATKISWFYTAHELVYARTVEDKEYVMDFSMEQLEQQLDPEVFFRANRQFIINRTAITEVDFYFNGRLSVKVKPQSAEHILISKARVPEFKKWMNS